MNKPVTTSDTSRSSALRMLTGGILGMMVAMGISRFSFTPILPLMQRDLGISHGLAGILASLNYTGYLAGALLCSIWPTLLRNRTVNIGALLICIATTLLMAAGLSPFWWGSLRLAAGIASAILFVVIAIEVSEHLAYCHRNHWSSALYAGIGLGIAVSGSTVPLLDYWGGWRAAWLGMAGISLLLALAGITIAGKQQGAINVPDSASPAGSGNLSGINRLATAYFLEGMGYIVSATFLVTMVAHTAGLSSFAPWIWVVVGLAAAPSTIIWQRIAIRLGSRSALTLAYLIQASGILLSINAQTPLSAGLSAMLFGGTFLAIVALIMAEAGRRCGKAARQATAVLTACFGAGQVIGPSLAGVLADQQGGFNQPLLLAALLVICGGILVASDRGYQKHITTHNP